MTIITEGKWIDGCTHTIVDDDQWTEPEPKIIMAHFLKITEDQLMDQLSAETTAGTLTQERAESIMIGYMNRKLTYNAYKG